MVDVESFLLKLLSVHNRLGAQLPLCVPAPTASLEASPSPSSSLELVVRDPIDALCTLLHQLEQVNNASERKSSAGDEQLTCAVMRSFRASRLPRWEAPVRRLRLPARCAV